MRKTIICTMFALSLFTLNHAAVFARPAVEASETKSVKEIKAEYTRKLYYGDVPSAANVRIWAIYDDGSREKTDADYSLPKYGLTKNAKLPVKKGGLRCELGLPLVKHESVTAKANIPIYEGTTAAKESFSFTLHYKDGETRPYTEEGPVLIEKNTIQTKLGNAKLESEIIPIESVTVIDDEEMKEGDVLDDFDIRIEYADGASKSVDSDKLENMSDTLLEHGLNTITFDYDGYSYEVYVQAAALTNVEKELPYMEEEIESADYAHVSDSIIVTINAIDSGDAFYYLSHILVNEPSQIKAGLSFNSYGGERETPTSAAERLGWVIGTNGSNFRYEDGKPDMANVRIKNGQVMDDSMNQCNGMEICLLPDGTVFAPTQDMTADDLLAMGVTDTWCCGDTVLIQNGSPVNEEIQSQQYRYPRTAFGMVRPCEYYIITAGDGGYERGMSYTEVRNVLLDNGCTFGKCMDGGGSSSLVFEGELINTPATNEERPVSDFLYFVEEEAYDD